MGAAAERGAHPGRVEQPDRPVGCDREAGDRGRAGICGVRVAAVGRDDEPARRALMGRRSAGDRVRTGRVHRIRRRRAGRLGDERPAEAVEREAERRRTRGRARDARLRATVVTDGKRVDRPRALLGHDELRAVRRERDLCRVGAEQRLRGPADRLDAPVAVDLEAGDRRRAGVEHVEQVLVDRDARRQDAVRGERRLKFEPIALDGEL